MVGKRRDRELADRIRLGEFLIKISDCINTFIDAAVEERELSNKSYYELLGYDRYASCLVDNTLQKETSERIVSLYRLAVLWDSGMLAHSFRNQELSILLLEPDGHNASEVKALGTRDERLAALAPVSEISGELRAIGNILIAGGEL